ncbi:DUF4440 domain-containing protein [Nocardia wallacei]|uniref:DUF4440 domain-containing protein n=1 Tax=Nocardia wallacei TaxID=480035 RepID=UPI002456EBA8|nr:DUF4440 domain-containing protein [Nocardia wallacei]
MSIDHDVVVDEIHTLHRDLARWLGGADGQAVERFVAQLHPDFSMVGLDGVVVPRARLVEGLRGGGGTAPGLTIEIVDIEQLHRTSDGAVMRFEEVHRGPEGTAARLTTALLLPDPQARNGFRWRSVHETAAPNRIRSGR